ncbi:FAD-binding oxidoreductase [Pseudoruegeria sp. SK021]|uniref:NAD(P)/FAD-dependent oxidoreductase n=1 Tax=Pseudoruegeria sp. SK021 TaxID=1933035 RepID=UPI000A24F3E7|nr:FAD-binding oxidoreductase [Pseudoruegeria sp. SK021]OSP54261.1 oxidoreductase [Pseudoruegeria sp. SK021]
MNLLHANDQDGAYPPSWYAATADPLPPCPPLTGAVRTDVCIVGGGYTGLSAALHLAQRGYQVRLVEAQRIGFGASGRNGGQVGSGQRLEQDALEPLVGPDDAARLWQIGEDAKAKVAQLIADHGIDCAYRPGVAHAYHHSSALPQALSLVDTLARRYDYGQLEVLDRDGIAAATGSPVFAGGVLDHGAGHLHPLRFALGLAQAAQAAGAVLHERSEVIGIAAGPRPQVTTATGQITADYLILACNGYLGGLAPEVAARVMPINNFILATEPLTDRAPDILPGDIAVADDRFVVNYWRKSADGRLLFGGGESYGYRFPGDIAAVVRKPMLAIYPQLAGVRIDHAWGGTLAITRSRLPCFAALAPNILTASGYSGHGVALATLAGEILSETIAGTAGRFDLMARLPTPGFPGGTALRSPLLALAMTWFALRDRLGI